MTPSNLTCTFWETNSLLQLAGDGGHVHHLPLTYIPAALPLVTCALQAGIVFGGVCVCPQKIWKTKQNLENYWSEFAGA